MNDIGKRKDCALGSDIVSYMYDEMPANERPAFEKHLLECAECTDEFAAISEARFSVFEWKKEEFAPLPTPVFQVPVVREPARSSLAEFFDTVKGIFATPQFAFAALMTAAVAIGLYFVGTSLLDRNQPQVAANTAKNEVTAQQASEVPAVKPSTEVVDEPRDEDTPKPVKISSPAKPRLSGKTVVIKKNAPAQRKTSIDEKAPVLSSFDDGDEKSLRLADLFDEIGGIYK
jgi:hypothetical protein